MAVIESPLRTLAEKVMKPSAPFTVPFRLEMVEWLTKEFAKAMFTGRNDSFVYSTLVPEVREREGGGKQASEVGIVISDACAVFHRGVLNVNPCLSLARDVACL